MRGNKLLQRRQNRGLSPQRREYATLTPFSYRVYAAFYALPEAYILRLLPDPLQERVKLQQKLAFQLGRLSMDITNAMKDIWQIRAKQEREKELWQGMRDVRKLVSKLAEGDKSLNITEEYVKRYCIDGYEDLLCGFEREDRRMMSFLADVRSKEWRLTKYY